MKTFYIYIFILSFGLASVLTPLVGKIARRMKLLDYPSKKKIHLQPVPLLGGLAVYLAFLIPLLYNLGASPGLMSVVIGGTIIFLMGLIDDLKGLPPEVKLIGQIVAAFIIMKGGIILTFLPESLWGWTGEILLTMFWIVGITNAFNFLDGMDGLAAGLTIISCFFFFLIALQTGQIWLGALTVSLAGASLGFLPYNFRPATIFLGDAGSTFLGFTLASLAIMGNWAKGNPIVALSVPILILGVFIFNMAYVTIARIKRGKVSTFREWVSYCAKDHIHHHLSALGLSQPRTVLFIYLISICLGISALVLRDAPNTIDAILMLGQALIIFIIIFILMALGRKRIDRGKI
jgi:UDP-GlcNAc:undecaprenyl-phosphate GlcNAc-1-phosphate transferase